MTGVDPIRDLRFEGMDIPQLTDWIGKIKQGRGSESMNRAVQALDQCVQVVVELDDTLRTELGKLGIAWEGNAGDLAQAAAQQRSVVMQQAQDPLRGSARSVEAQGRGYDSAKHCLPNSDELRHKQSENFLEWAGGAFGYESDYDEEAKQIDGRKKAAQAALGSYRDTTVTQAQQYQPLPQMPAPTVAASAGASGSVPSAGSGAPGFGGYGGDAVAAGGGFVGAERSTSGFVGGERSTSGGGRAGSDEPSAGGRSGTEDRREDSAEPGGNADPMPEGGDSGIGLGGVLGIGAGGAAVAGIGAVAAGRLLGGRGGAARAGGAAEGRAATPGRGGSSGIGGGPGDTTAGRTAGSSPGSRPAAGSVMGPAATRGKKAAEDEEHENRYTAEETPFDDERLVAPPVLGGTGEPDEKQD